MFGGRYSYPDLIRGLRNMDGNQARVVKDERWTFFFWTYNGHYIDHWPWRRRIFDSMFWRIDWWSVRKAIRTPWIEFGWHKI